jgi:hypothetical protein
MRPALGGPEVPSIEKAQGRTLFREVVLGRRHAWPRVAAAALFHRG